MRLDVLAEVIVTGAERVLDLTRNVTVYMVHNRWVGTGEDWRIYRNEFSTPARLFVTIDTPTHVVIASAELRP